MASSLLALLVALWVLACARAQQVLTAPTVIFGLQPQRPPVARVNVTWTWQLLPGTFQSAASDSLTYSATPLPSWASFDPIALAFSGVPRASDVGDRAIYVTANSTTMAGASVTDSFQLRVENTRPPTIKYPIAEQLPNATTLPAGCILQYNGAVRVPPRWSFSVGLQWDTFALASGDFAYYTAYLLGTTSLPSWLSFDPATVTFDGVAPYSGTYDVVVFGSNHYGYGDVSQTFRIQVESHSFDLVHPLPSLNTSLGAVVNYTIPIAGLTIDRVPVTAANITSTSVALASLPFLTYSPATRQISGTVPASAVGVNSTIIPVTFNNTYGNALTANLTFAVSGAAAASGLLTTSAIPALVVQPGQSFRADLSQYATAADAEYSTSYQPATAGQWLAFDASNLTLSGTAPSPAPAYGNVTVTLSARERTSGAMQNATLPIAFSAMSPGAGELNSGGNGGLSDGGKTALAAVFGGLGGLGLLILLGVCCRRRRKARREEAEEEMDDRKILKDNVSPYLGGNSPYLGGSPYIPGSPYLGAEKEWGPSPVVAAAAPVPHKPKRLDLMNVFTGKSAPRKSTSQTTGLGIDDDALSASHVVVVTDADREGDTYRPDSDAGSSFALDDSSWGSRSTTASMFYSEQELTTSRSVPRQRRDFMVNPPPLPPPVQISPSPTRAVFGETSRAVNSPSLGSMSPSLNDSRRFSQTHIGEATIATAALHEVEAGSTVRPRLIPFTSERATQRQRTPPRDSRSESQTGRYGEVDEEELLRTADARFSVQSAPYRPPEGPVAASPIFYSPAPSPMPDQHAAFPNGGLRLVGGAASSSSARPRRQRTHTMSSGVSVLQEPQRVTVGVGEPVHFTPALHPPPLASIGSPGRHGPPRKAYTAVLDYPEDPARDRRALPEWLHFDVKDLEFWGIPRIEDLGDVHVQVVERRTAPGSPKRRTAGSEHPSSPPPTRPGTATTDDEDEQVVGRVVLSVVDKRASADMGHAASSSVQVVRF